MQESRTITKIALATLGLISGVLLLFSIGAPTTPPPPGISFAIDFDDGEYFAQSSNPLRPQLKRKTSGGEQTWVMPTEDEKQLWWLGYRYLADHRYSGARHLSLHLPPTVYPATPNKVKERIELTVADPSNDPLKLGQTRVLGYSLYIDSTRTSLVKSRKYKADKVTRVVTNPDGTTKEVTESITNLITTVDASGNQVYDYNTYNDFVTISQALQIKQNVYDESGKPISQRETNPPFFFVLSSISEDKTQATGVFRGLSALSCEPTSTVCDHRIRSNLLTVTLPTDRWIRLVITLHPMFVNPKNETTLNVDAALNPESNEWTNLGSSIIPWGAAPYDPYNPTVSGIKDYPKGMSDAFAVRVGTYKVFSDSSVGLGFDDIRWGTDNEAIKASLAYSPLNGCYISSLDGCPSEKKLISTSVDSQTGTRGVYVPNTEPGITPIRLNYQSSKSLADQCFEAVAERIMMCGNSQKTQGRYYGEPGIEQFSMNVGEIGSGCYLYSDSIRSRGRTNAYSLTFRSEIYSLENCIKVRNYRFSLSRNDLSQGDSAIAYFRTADGVVTSDRPTKFQVSGDRMNPY